jgi:hypothetical protein
MADTKGKDLPNWEAFEGEVAALRSELGSGASPLLFRGQNNSEFPLSTTLERAGCERMAIRDYYRLIVSRVKPAIETFTGRSWQMPDYSIQLHDQFDDINFLSDQRFPSVELYPYMVYLRHHGLPSPLLDWSYSPYVAAFFAFRDGAANSQKRSIYAHCEMPLGGKGGAVGEPAMRQLGSYVKSHRRHFHTICYGFCQDKGWYFHPHEGVFGSRGKQDFLWKFNIPSSERVTVLRELDSYNLNAFSLFDSEEALLETLWLREYMLKDSRPL